MVEETKAPEVELDTDGVNEESVDIKETPKEPEATELPKEEVDLGILITAINVHMRRKKIMIRIFHMKTKDG